MDNGRGMYSFRCSQSSLGCLAAVTTNLLLYVNKSKKPNEVGWLDCTATPPKLAEGRMPIQLGHISVQDMCYVKVRQKELLVYISKDGVFAHDSRSSKNVWSITETSQGPLKNPSSVTADGRGHIFVSDINNSVVLMFSCDGIELATVMDFKGIGKLGPVCWCESEKCLVISHGNWMMWKIIVVKLQHITD